MNLKVGTETRPSDSGAALARNAVGILKTGARSYDSCLQKNGEIFDPVFGEQFQYGTPYYALCNAVLALKTEGKERDDHIQKTLKAFNAALRHVVDPNSPSGISIADRDTASSVRINHRDFYWPAIMKSLLILKRLGQKTGRFEREIRSVDVEKAFHTKPPNNWAAVWLSGEWLRIREGLSPNSPERFDKWLEVFFRGHVLVEKGFYQESGHPNSYEVYTRFYMADILSEGYAGRFKKELARLMETGLKRSLGVQLSDGSLASAYRSSGVTWTASVQCAFFTYAAKFFASRDKVKSRLAREGARRALSSFARWQRPDGFFCPGENRLPVGYRVGCYEGYFSEGNYGPSALGLLALAVLNGFEDEILPSGAGRPARVLIEHDPIYRAAAHYGPYSVHFNAFPCPAGHYFGRFTKAFDGFGIVDMTFGPNRFLHFATSARSMESGELLNVGMAYKNEQVDGQLAVVARKDYMLTNGFRKLAGKGRCGFSLEGRCKGECHTYAATVAIDKNGIKIRESTPGLDNFKTLLIPYLRDPGTGTITEVHTEKENKRVRLVHGNEEIEFLLEQDIDRAIHLPYGYENRRGLCGLVRIDFKGRMQGISYRVRLVK